MKTCGKCKQEKLPTHFYKQTKSKDGLQKNCKDCQREQRSRNCKAELSTPEGRAKYLAWAKAWSARFKKENSEKWRVTHNKAQLKQYHKNKDKFREWQAKYLKRIRDEISPVYVRKLIASQVGCSRAQVPEELVVAKKAHIAARQLIRERSK